jgi:hypothetical protein
LAEQARALALRWFAPPDPSQIDAFLPPHTDNG